MPILALRPETRFSMPVPAAWVCCLTCTHILQEVCQVADGSFCPVPLASHPNLIATPPATLCPHCPWPYL